jgi:hypothetical protein
MDHWPQGAGEIPERPRDAFVQQTPERGFVDPAYANPPAAVAPAHQPNGYHRKTRAEVREMRRQEREVGVPFWLKKSEMEARVRDLPFADRIMLKGIPAEMRVSIEQAIDLTANAAGSPGITAALKLVDAEADLSDGVCIAGFIWPRLVRTQMELQQLIGQGADPEDVWLVEDLHPEEKAAYRDFVFRDRTDGEKEDTARLASFPGAGLAQAADRQDRESEMSSTLPGAPDGGVGLRPRDAAFAG